MSVPEDHPRPGRRPSVAHAVALATDAMGPNNVSLVRDAPATLDSLAEVCVLERDAILECAALESHLDRARLDDEFERTVHQLRYLADVARRPAPCASGTIRRVAVPIGPVGVFAASNFPLAFGMLGGDTASALASGCAVVAKPHPSQPELGRLLAAVAARGIAAAGADPASFGVIDSDLEAGIELVRHPLLAGFSFTGSSAGGRSLLEAAASRASPLVMHLEMGSVNPALIAPAAAATRPDGIAAAIGGSIMARGGQLCTKNNVVIVHDAVADRLCEALVDILESSRPVELLANHVADGWWTRLAELEDAGVTWDLRPKFADRGRVVTASVATMKVTGPLPSVVLGETFGPTTTILRCSDDAAVDSVIASCPGSLAASVFADDADLAWASHRVIALAARAGRIVWNAPSTGVAVVDDQLHGGPWPATNWAAATSIGDRAIDRWLRSVALCDLPPTMVSDLNAAGMH